jgi:outer membrane lipoprotein carrier protein LolA
MFRKIPLFLAAVLSLPSARGEALEPDSLIRRLARPAPASIAFREVRLSPLLREPLILSGELSYLGPARLERQVTRPYIERTAVHGESVRVEREGEPPRSFALRRAPELRGLLTGFAALLAGDSAQLRGSFAVEVDGDETGWRLNLIPSEARARRRLQRIEVTGSAQLARCFMMLNVDGGASVMLLGSMAAEALPTKITVEKLREQCAGAAAANSSRLTLQTGSADSLARVSLR